MPNAAGRQDGTRRDRAASGPAAAHVDPGRPAAAPAGPGRPDAAHAATGPRGEAGDSQSGAAAGDVAAARPFGVLISADRYDLAELAES